jgi:glycosyltransferase involved in cell wall biosynthesis
LIEKDHEPLRIRPCTETATRSDQRTGKPRREPRRRPTRSPAAVIAVIVPAHNEEARIGACLASIRIAARCPRLQGEPVLMVVVLDDCSDATGSIARSGGAETLREDARNVGRARAAGARHALEAGARWLAFTDADSVVAADWLSAQLAERSDAVCGTVQVDDWGARHAGTRERFDAAYVDACGHRHVHGANLGVTAGAYERAGGFPHLVTSEDVALVKALLESGARVAWSALPRVVTSARSCFRAPGGFGETIAHFEREALSAGAPT